jgi:hypothetical protein
MKKTAVLSVLVLGLMGALAVAPAFADDTLYDNTYSGSYGNSVNWNQSTNGTTDSFVLNSNATVTGAMVALWLYPGDTATYVTWQITQDPFGIGDELPIDGGTASVSTSNYVTSFTYSSGDFSESWDIDNVTFSIPDLSLPAGQYWFELDGVTTAGGNGAGWDESDGPSIAYNLDAGPVGSETFQILGSPDSVTPEPSSFLLLGSGLLGLAGLVKRKLVV